MEEIIKKCKYSVTLEVNNYRDNYEKIEDATSELLNKDLITSKMCDKMIKENTIISLQFYPDTPIGFYKVYGASLEEVFTRAHFCFEE